MGEQNKKIGKKQEGDREDKEEKGETVRVFFLGGGGGGVNGKI